MVKETEYMSHIYICIYIIYVYIILYIYAQAGGLASLAVFSPPPLHYIHVNNSLAINNVNCHNKHES